MRKLMIVEDEKSIYFLLNSCIRYDELELELVGYAENGQTAFDMIMEKRPDIVITDITMPILDGLELIEKVQTRQFYPKFIIISGYAQFEFAKKAVKLGVKDYLLKPINSSELNKSLLKLVREFSDNESPEVSLRTTDNQKEKLHTSLIMSVLYGDVDFDRISAEQINRDYLCTFQEGYFCALVIKTDYFSDIVTGIKNHITDNLIAVIKENFSDLCYEIGAAEHQENIYVVINCKEQQPEKIKAICKRVIMSGKKLTDEYVNAGITVCVGIIVTRINDLPESLESALRMLDTRIIHGIDQVLMAKGEKQGEEKKYSLSAELLQPLIEKVECNRIAEIKEEISAIFRDVLEFCRREEVSVYKTFRGVLFHLLSIIKEKGTFPDEFTENYQDLLLELDKCSRVCDITETLAEKMVEGMLKFQEDEQSEGSIIMKRILDYIGQNYYKQLKLEDVAEQVYITPAYLGIIFKKETGENFTTYLTELRMRKAKELLLDVRININEIAYKVGYNNVRYFSRIFKENVGITPKEYRKIHANRNY